MTPVTDTTSRRYIDTRTLMQIRSLELRARVVVHGFWNGIHRSPYHGFSVEFTEYANTFPVMTCAISIGGSMLAATATTSRNLKMKPIFVAISCWIKAAP